MGIRCVEIIDPYIIEFCGQLVPLGRRRGNLQCDNASREAEMVLKRDNFNALPEKKQVYRLRKLADAALEKFGFNQYQLTFLQHLVNTTFRLDCNQGRYLVRIHRARTRAAVASELAWLEALTHETTVPVQIPQRSLDGEMIVVGEQIGVPEPYPVTVLSWLDGQILPQDRRSPHHFYRLGQFVAKLHRHAEHWTPPFELDRPLYDSTSVLRTDNVFGEEAVTYKQLPEEVQRASAKVARTVTGSRTTAWAKP